MIWLLIPVYSGSFAARSLEKTSAKSTYSEETEVEALLTFNKAI